MRLQSVPVLSVLANLGSISAKRHEKDDCHVRPVKPVLPINELPCKPCHKKDNCKECKPEKPCHKNDICCEVKKCKGVLPACCKVTSKDHLRHGELSKAYRRANRKCDSKCDDLKDAIVCCSKDSFCGNLTFERFLCAVQDTARIISNGKVVCFDKHQKKIIENIYHAGCKLNATCHQLIIFTATAMHNCYLFAYFPECGSDSSIGTISRGLMQWLSHAGYSNVSKVSEVNYLHHPYLLDLYTFDSIKHEFKAYLDFYFNSNCRGIEKFIFTIKAFNSKEAHLVNREVAEQIERKTYIPCDELQMKVLRRFNIYYALINRIFNHKKTSVKISN